MSRMVDELVTLLDGTPSPIVSHLLENENLSQSDLNEIRRMIAEKTEEKGNNP